MKDFLRKLKSSVSKITSNKKLFWLHYVVYFIGLIFLDFSFRYFYKHTATYEVVGNNAVWFSVCWAFLLTAISAILPRLIRRIFIGITGILFSVLALVNAGMYSVFGLLSVFLCILNKSVDKYAKICGSFRY